MPITNAQYDEIMRGYNERQLHNHRILSKRKSDAYLKVPQFQEIDEAIAALSVQQTKKRLEGDTTALNELHTLIASYRAKRLKLLQENGYPEDYFSPIYCCTNCKDTGYIDGEKCHCFKQAIINMVYSQSNICKILERENFSTFSYEYFSDDEINPMTGLSSLATMHQAVRQCHLFIDNFEHKPRNLFFYGDTGVGKTFLSNCVAKELLDKGYSVIYFTAFQLFDILSKDIFQKNTDAIAAHQNIFDCDLLIIDDLGTELPNSFTTSQLFLCVNERILRQKSTIISTNLNMSQMFETYSERTLSRISINYTIMKLFGDDIRIKKRQTG